MKQLLFLFLLIPALAAILFFFLSQKYKNTATFPIPTPTLSSSATTSERFCTAKDIAAKITTEGAAGNIYGTVMIKNISTTTCTIQGDMFVDVKFTAPNIIVSKQGQIGPAAINLQPSQTVYSQIHYPNGPQCSGGITQTPVTFTYAISSRENVEIVSTGNLPATSITTCVTEKDTTQLDVWSISLIPLH